MILLCALALGIVPLSSMWAGHSHHHHHPKEEAKQAIDEWTEALKRGVDKVGDNIAALQDYLNHYSWKGIVQDEASSGAATLKHMQLNGHSRVVAVRPGERIYGQVLCQLNSKECSPLGVYRVVLGFAGIGGQTTIGNELGATAGESLEKFDLIAPKEPGIYQIRFRLVRDVFASGALQAWVDEAGNEPSAAQTVGIVVVR